MKKIKILRENTLVKFFLCLFVVLIIPFIATLFSYIQARRVIQRQIIYLNDNKFNFYKDLSDNILESVSRQQFIALNSDVANAFSRMDISDVNKVNSASYNLSQYLKLQAQGFQESIFIYYPKYDYIIGNQNGMQSFEFWETNYEEQLEYDSFMNLIGAATVQPALVVLPDKNDSLHYTVGLLSAKKNLPTDQQPIAICFSKIDENLQRKLYYESGNQLLITDNSGHVILSSIADQLGNTVPIEEIQQQVGKQILINDSPYITQCAQSSVTDCWYVSLIPVSMYWKDLQQTAAVTVAASLTCLLIGIIFSRVLAKYNYQPLKELVDWMKGKESDGQEITSEYDYLRSKFNHIYLQLHQQQRENDARERNDSLLEALNGESAEVNLTQLNVTCPYVVLLYSFENCDKWDGNLEMVYPQQHKLMRFIIQNILEELSGTLGKGEVVHVGGKKFLLLLSIDGKVEPDKAGTECADFAAESRAILLAKTGLDALVAFSAVKYSSTELYNAFLSVEDSLQYRFVMKNQRVISAVEIADRNDMMLSRDVDEQLYSRIMDMIRGREAININNICALFSGTLPMDSVSLKTIRQMMEKILMTVQNVQQICKLYDERCKELFRQNWSTLDEFCSELMDYVIILHERYQMEKTNSAITDMVIKYINENFTSPGIGVATIAEHFNVSSGYLSKILRQSEGISIPEYINRLRVERAKELLLSEEYTVETVAEKCGFLSGNVFIKSFKKEVGVTPGMYRKSQKQ